MGRRGTHHASETPVVYLATSSGGHIDLLYAVRGAFEGYRRVWVVQPSQRGDLLASDGEQVHTLPKYDRHPIRGHFLGNILQAARLVVRERPRLVVTSGAGITVPFCLLTRLTGGKIIFVETMARVTGPSASGKALSRLASRVLVQWPEALGAYRRAQLCHPALLEAVTTEASPAGSGTFVAVGTHSQQFDRLLEIVDNAVARGILPTPVVAQGGVSRYQPRHYELRKWLTPDEVEQSVQDAEYVVCHAGSGLVSAALRAGRRPMVLPRLASCGEHFDDHQTQIVEKLADLDLVVKLDDGIGRDSIRAAGKPLPQPQENDGRPSVEEALRAELISELGPPSQPVPLATADPVTTAS
jgi:UDP-N-acetylglucosamine--N-acetylmuramyl-(pentapeptide) pyrophosphoryl-undecaprenol N-acetylglucosamine transferase